jgi:hypothetical protein
MSRLQALQRLVQCILGFAHGVSAVDEC